MFPVTEKHGCVSITQLDFGNNIDIILKANQLLLEPIKLYSSKNDEYVATGLKALDSLRDRTPSSNYYGKFMKHFPSLAEILYPSKYLVYLNFDKDKCGYPLYCILEAIDFNCALILHHKWLSNPDCPLEEGVHCFGISSSEDLVEILNKDPNTSQICKNAKKLFKSYIDTQKWDKIMS